MLSGSHSRSPGRITPLTAQSQGHHSRAEEIRSSLMSENMSTCFPQTGGLAGVKTTGLQGSEPWGYSWSQTHSFLPPGVLSQRVSGG